MTKIASNKSDYVILYVGAGFVRAEFNPRRLNILPDRLMVGHMVLVHGIGVRIPVGQLSNFLLYFKSEGKEF